MELPFVLRRVRATRAGHLHRRSRSSEHDGPAWDKGAPPGPQRDRQRPQSCQLRRVSRQSISRLARCLDAEKRQESYHAPDVVESAPAGDRRGHGTRSLRASAEIAAACDMDRDGQRKGVRGPDPGHREATCWACRQLGVSSDRCRYRHDLGDAGQRAGAGSRADDVRPQRPSRSSAAAGRRSGKDQRRAPGDAHEERPGHQEHPRTLPGVHSHRARGGASLRPAFSGRRARWRSPVAAATDRRWLGLCHDQPRQHSGRQRRRVDARNHRSGESRPAPQAGRLGRSQGLGMGRRARPRLSGNGPLRGRETRRHRRRVPLRQGCLGYDGLRAALRYGPGGIFRRRRGQAESP